jgi:serine/threonine protein kinase
MGNFCVFFSQVIRSGISQSADISFCSFAQAGIFLLTSSTMPAPKIVFAKVKRSISCISCSRVWHTCTTNPSRTEVNYSVDAILIPCLPFLLQTSRWHHFYALLIFVSHFIGLHNEQPENILLYSPGPYPRILIADFGLARPRSYQETLNVCGTVAYLPPEGILALDNKHLGYVGMPADCWSAGVILFVLLSYVFLIILNRTLLTCVLSSVVPTPLTIRTSITPNSRQITLEAVLVLKRTTPCFHKFLFATKSRSRSGS